MKIVHINNISGVASIIADQQRKQGHYVDVFVFNNILYKQFGGNKFNYYSPLSRWRFFKKLKEYDTWHYHYPYGSLKRNLEKQNQDKLYLKHYHGEDLRGRYDDDFCLVSTPDLLQYAPNGKWLPNPIDINEIESIPRKKQNDRMVARVAHYPYYKNYPSNEYYSNILAKLHSEKKCDIVKILNLPHIQTLENISTCDIVIGKILPNIGWFGKFELEAMALGKPVIAYASDELYEKYKPPIYRTTKDTFKQDLESLLEDNTERERLANEGPDYIKKYHSLEGVIKTVNECYNT
jgi:hypothetical protein